MNEIEVNSNRKMSKEDLKAFILAFYSAWKERNEEKVIGFYDPAVQSHVDFKPVTLQDMVNRLEFSHRKFLEADYHVQDLFVDESEGRIAVRMKQHYVFRETHETLSCDSITLYKVSDYKIKEIWMSFYPNADYLNNN